MTCGLASESLVHHRSSLDTMLLYRRIANAVRHVQIATQLSGVLRMDPTYARFSARAFCKTFKVGVWLKMIHEKLRAPTYKMVCDAGRGFTSSGGFEQHIQYAHHHSLDLMVRFENSYGG